MNHVITTFILIALAAKTKAQPKDNLINQELREKSTIPDFDPDYQEASRTRAQSKKR